MMVTLQRHLLHPAWLTVLRCGSCAQLSSTTVSRSKRHVISVKADVLAVPSARHASADEQEVADSSAEGSVSAVSRLDEKQPRHTNTPWEPYSHKVHHNHHHHHHQRSDKPEALRTLLNWTDPPMLYQRYRMKRRTIVLHVGPTNSGKTHNAMKALTEADRGLYLAPLRLLAYENYERLTQEGRACSLLTGQERELVRDSTHFSCTMEMANLTLETDVAVIDEIQLIGDRDRGWAWTRALLGIPAKEIHCCGDPSAVDIVKRLGSACGDRVVVKEYSRLLPLEVGEGDVVNSISDLKPGDCLISFGRRHLYDFKQRIELTGRKCCIVYGGLPPETRREQAGLFNDPDNDYDYLVASDAIGMGLNLSIGRIIFTSLTKFDGTTTRTLHAPEVRQIAGRAGRFNSKYQKGVATVFQDADNLDLLAQLYNTPVESMGAAGIFPTDELLRTVAQETERLLRGQTPPFSEVVDFCMNKISYDKKSYFICNEAGTDMRKIAEIIEPFDLSLDDRIRMTKAPLKIASTRCVQAMKDMVDQYVGVTKGHQQTVQLPRDVWNYRENIPASPLQVQWTEDTCRILELYLWFQLMFDGPFTHGGAAQQLYMEHSHLIAQALSKSGALKKTHAFKGENTANTLARRQRRKSKQNLERAVRAHLE